MGLAHSPRIVTDGITFLMDAQSEKGFGTDDFTKARTRIINNPGDRNAGEDVIVKHSQGPFPGAGYVNIDGTSRTQGLTLPSVGTVMGDGTGDWTIEFWYMTPSFTTSGGTTTVIPLINNIYWYNSNDGSFWSYVTSNRKIALSTQHSGGAFGTEVDVVSTTTISTNNWYHIAFVKQGNTLRLYFNGVQEDTDTVTNLSSSGFNSGGNALSIGRWYNYQSSAPDTSEYGIGNFSNVRIVNSAVYPDGTSFTPAGNPLKAVTDTKLLTCQKGTITDASSSGHSITVNGDAAAVYPSLGSYVFDGNQGSQDQKIQFSSPLFNSNSNFTLSIWYEASSTSDLISNTSGAGLSVELGTRVMIQEPYGGGQLTYTAGSSTVVSLDQIYNVVITRNGTSTTSFSVFVNGEEVSVSNINNGGSEIFSQHPNVIGSRYNGGGTPAYHFQGKLYQMCAYQRVLTDSEIQQNFNALKGRFGI